VEIDKKQIIMKIIREAVLCVLRKIALLSLVMRVVTICRIGRRLILWRFAVPNENENTSNELDSLFMTNDESSEGGDDFFSLGEGVAMTDGAGGSDDSGSINIEVEENPFETTDSSSTNPFESSDSFASGASSDAFGADSSSLEVPTSVAAAGVAASTISGSTPEELDLSGKKGKRAKKEKAAKAPKAKVAKKEKAAKAPKAPKGSKEPKVKRPYCVSPFPFFVLFFALLIVVACVIVAAFAIGGGGAVAFLIPAGVLMLVILAAPFMLLSHLRKEPVGLFDMMLALASIFVAMSVIVVLAYQAKTYGASSKVALNVPVVVASLDC